MSNLEKDVKAYVSGKSQSEIEKDALAVLSAIKTGKIVEKDMIGFAANYGITITTSEATRAIRLAKAVDVKKINVEEVKKIVRQVASSLTAKPAAASTKTAAAPAATTKTAATVSTSAKPAAKSTDLKPEGNPVKTAASTTTAAAKTATTTAAAAKQTANTSTTASAAAKTTTTPAKTAAAPAKTASATPAKTTASTAGQKYIVTASVLNVRSGAGTSHSILGTVKKDAAVQVLEEKNNWGRISYNGKEGWISLNYAQKAISEAAPGSSYVVTAHALHVRKGPGVSNDVLGYLGEKDAVRVIEVKNGWGKISYKGKEGWVSMNYLAKK